MPKLRRRRMLMAARKAKQAEERAREAQGNDIESQATTGEVGEKLGTSKDLAKRLKDERAVIRDDLQKPSIEHAAEEGRVSDHQQYWFLRYFYWGRSAEVADQNNSDDPSRAMDQLRYQHYLQEGDQEQPGAEESSTEVAVAPQQENFCSPGQELGIEPTDEEPDKDENVNEDQVEIVEPATECLEEVEIESVHKRYWGRSAVVRYSSELLEEVKIEQQEVPVEERHWSQPSVVRYSAEHSIIEIGPSPLDQQQYQLYLTSPDQQNDQKTPDQKVDENASSWGYCTVM